MRRSPWPTDKVKKTYQEKVASHVSGKGLVLTLDATNFPKGGHHSPGVGRQYGGRDGKVDPNQESVMCGLVSDDEYALPDYRLYLPEHWFDEAHGGLRDECGIPEGQKFETKNTIAGKMIVAMRDNLEVKPEHVLVDAGFGHDRVFWDSLRVPYFADIHSTDKFFASAPSFAVPPWGGRGRAPVVPRPDIEPLQASLIIGNSPASWEKVSFGLGSWGYVVGEEKIVRVMEIRDKLPRNWIWLYARKFENGKIRCSIGDLPEDTPVETFRDLARKRWTIEQSFEECESDLGLTLSSRKNITRK